jgi:hypothetical protein
MLRLLANLLCSKEEIAAANPPLESIRWSQEEWTKVSPLIYKIPASRYKHRGGETVASEGFAVLLARFLEQHPNLEVVSTTPICTSSNAWTDYVVVQCRQVSGSM